MTPAVEEIRSARPESSEYVPYFGTYISKVNDGDVVRHLKTQIGETRQLLDALSDQQAALRYAPGKWSIREVVGHLCDAERIFGYRAMRFARGDSTPLSSFDENVYVENARFDQRTLASLADEFSAVRAGSIVFFDSLNEGEWLRRGVANSREMSVRALAWTVAGHELHHREIVRTRYLGLAA